MRGGDESCAVSRIPTRRRRVQADPLLDAADTEGGATSGSLLVDVEDGWLGMVLLRGHAIRRTVACMSHTACVAGLATARELQQSWCTILGLISDLGAFADWVPDPASGTTFALLEMMLPFANEPHRERHVREDGVKAGA